MVLRMIPTVPMIGVAGSFSLSDIIAPLYGIILGPYTGGLSIILGSFLAIALGRPVTFMGLDFLPATLNAIALGLLIKRKWALTVGLNAVLLLAFLLHPLTLILISFSVNNTAFSFPFAWMHIVAFVVLLSPIGRNAAKWVKTSETTKIVFGLTVLAFIGTMIQHLMGNLLFEVILGQVLGTISPGAYPGIWTTIFLVYPLERLALIIFAVIVGTPLLRAVQKSFLK
jgi:hypothetical protein